MGLRDTCLHSVNDPTFERHVREPCACNRTSSAALRVPLPGLAAAAGSILSGRWSLLLEDFVALCLAFPIVLLEECITDGTQHLIATAPIRPALIKISDGLGVAWFFPLVILASLLLKPTFVQSCFWIWQSLARQQPRRPTIDRDASF
ncbi:hypothetical protein K437DRAFT_173333 [Tilletiaria anomala UBC 951]|uniref:Uncharacterized protein n=1 Tax=Tilletiaria anomala (strain ATCC 24038 / CBS 436.72 / UBC 951) TaxID=1037660 RepID=A0A066WJ53_TILAU|nr:uncharacterized protein K437DRAFT_173333 [Tilletiaria anomala UBC 951]KDN52588.1 hypothetical protein K437DRAFT_173333 [Tilletiaria anomala UBC 951]